ncbi:MAG TPA: hypothetical protein VMH32_02345 [Burkholderiales bacterium]|nr:hypothetical protein [Burkholderiales bacterium]
MSDTVEPPRGGFRYWVSDEQLRAYGRMSVLARLKWLDEARCFTLLTETPETRERRQRLRRGETIA